MNKIGSKIRYLLNKNVRSESNEFNKLESKYQDIHNDLNKDLPEGIIYHYTSFAGLKNIVKERKLRHTDYRFFNDPTEIEYGQNIILQALSNTNIERRKIERTRELFNDFGRQLHLYIACFSTEIKKLALWRYYASNGTGFAIGFNKNFHKAEKTSVITEKGCICNVIYGNNNATNVINRFINGFLNSNDEQHFRRLLFKKLLIPHLIAILPLFKDDSFKDEHEVRLVYMEGKIVADPTTDQPFFFEDQDRQFIPITANHLPFVNTVKGNKPTVTPDKFCDADISEIWVGPSCEFFEARSYIYNLLQEEGYDLKNIEIKPCQLSFRDI